VKKFTQVKSKAIPLPIKDVDTDQIIPAQYLTSISSDGYGKNLFKRLREESADFPMNQPRFTGAKILIADHNFGCGSSREHAVWALMGAGIEVMIGKSFADIFTGNSANNGFLLITLPSDTVDMLLKTAAETDLELTVDLVSQEVRTAEGSVFKFDYDPFRKHCLINGLDDIDYILSEKSSIDSYRNKQADKRFFSTVANEQN
jgi:3-isopropylmalate/(R)-2-methylmalate dehydratase small subunit